MNENDFAKKLKPWLDRAADQVPFNASNRAAASASIVT